MTEMKSVYSAVRTGSLNKAVCASSLKGQQGFVNTFAKVHFELLVCLEVGKEVTQIRSV